VKQKCVGECRPCLDPRADIIACGGGGAYFKLARLPSLDEEILRLLKDGMCGGEQE